MAIEESFWLVIQGMNCYQLPLICAAEKPQKPQQLIEAHASPGNQVVIDTSILRSSWVAAEILAVLECIGWICSWIIFLLGSHNNRW